MWHELFIFAFVIMAAGLVFRHFALRRPAASCGGGCTCKNPCAQRGDRAKGQARRQRAAEVLRKPRLAVSGAGV